MNGTIFREYLLWFNARMLRRKVVLLIDGFSAYESELATVEEEGGLANVKVLFLLPNTTSICQPLDQGIIKAWKAHYREQWLSFAVGEFEEERDPDKTMNVLQAFRWGISVWRDKVTSFTILKSRVLGPKYGPMTKKETKKADLYKEKEKEEEQTYSEMTIEMQTTMKHLEETGRIQKAMQSLNF